MVIDPEETISKITSFIHEQLETKKKDGVLIGLSGGVDSTVAAYIAARAVKDPSRMHSLHLYDRDSQNKFRVYAEKIAHNLSINLEMRDISDDIKSQGVYKPWIMRVVPFSTFINKMILLSNKILSPILYGETPFVVTLKRMNPDNMSIGFIARIAKTIENGFNARHILRRKILEEYAEEHNLLLIGAANKSESFVGWFVKDGVDDLPIEVLLDLYKNQVRQLGEYLGIPDYVLSEAPSPDMFKGIGDEDCIGHKYDIIDRVAFAYHHNLMYEDIISDEISWEDYEHILKLHKLSAWKREATHEYPKIVDAEIHGGVYR